MAGTPVSATFIYKIIMTFLLKSLCLLCLFLSVGVARVEAAQGESLADLAWRYTDLIVADEDARMAARHRVIDAMIDRGDLTGALTRATTIEGWRKLDVFARLGELAARSGDTNVNVRYGQEIEYQLPGLNGWEYTHILGACLRVKALAGDRNYISSVTNLYAGNAKITAMAGAADVFIRASGGELADGMPALEAIAANGDYDVVLACVEFGRLLVDGQPDRLISTNMIAGAMQLIQGVPGNRRMELLIGMIDDLGSSMEPASRINLAQAVIDELTSVIYPPHIRGFLWADLAVACAPMEELRQSAHDALSAARPLLAELMLIEQPLLSARIAEAEARLGRIDVARQLLTDAYFEAGRLVNARPRYAALVEVTLAAYRAGLVEAIPVDGLRPE